MLCDMLIESFSDGKNISVLALIVLCIFVTSSHVCLNIFVCSCNKTTL